MDIITVQAILIALNVWLIAHNAQVEVIALFATPTICGFHLRNNVFNIRIHQKFLQMKSFWMMLQVFVLLENSLIKITEIVKIVLQIVKLVVVDLPAQLACNLII